MTRFGIMRSAALVGSIAGVIACAPLTPEPETAPDTQSSARGQGVEELFAGRFPGVEVAKPPGGGITVRIRGSSTVVGDSEPLYIIDGARVQSGPGGLLFLDPNDIKKIEVLKDIGSTSFYGSEGANGVILITTKTARK
jgi:TonB-dependent starch-binding outer membrane protein SusC